MQRSKNHGLLAFDFSTMQWLLQAGGRDQCLAFQAQQPAASAIEKQ